jgi:CelD/BcsL family acetyltransferase involved in cellulose biosynthesis
MVTRARTPGGSVRTRTIPPTTVGVQVHRGLDPFLKLRGEWEELHAGSAPGNPFLSFTWTAAWLRCFAGEYEDCLTVVVNQPDRCRGVASLVRRRRRHAGVPLRVLELAGGDDSTYKGLLAEGDHDAFADAVLQGLHEQGGAWDLLVFDSLPGDDGWSRRMAGAAARRSLRFELHPPTPAPFLSLPADYESLVRGLKKSLRRNLSRRQKQMEAEGLSIERWRGAAVQPEHVRQAREIEQRSWKGSRGLGIFPDEPHLAFHLALLSDRDRPFEVDYAFLHDGDRPIAFQYGLLQGSKYLAYNTSYDHSHHGVSPGLLLIHALLRDLVGSGVETFDFLVGEDTYKLDWTSQVAFNEGVTVFRSSPTGRALFLGRLLQTKLRALSGRSDPIGRLAARLLRRKVDPAGPAD